MYFTGRDGEQLGLTLVSEENVPKSVAKAAVGPQTSRLERMGGADTAVVTAARAHFGATAPKRASNPLPKLPLLRDNSSGRLRTVYKEIVIRFAPDLSAVKRNRLLKAHKLVVQRTNVFVSDQVVVKGDKVGLDLLEPANALAEEDEVLFAVPNFVTEYRRSAATIRIPVAQWHLQNRAKVAGQLAGEDVSAREAWRTTKGKSSVIVAVVDDGVDIDHPNLKRHIWHNPNPRDPDQHGRDYFIPDDNPDHFDPRPKRFEFPFDNTDKNDIHGTCCAGVVAAAGLDAWGIAPGCTILPVKIFHANDMAADERVADSIRYSATRAAVISCSWSGARTPDLAMAIEDAGRIGRGGLGSAVVCATGNDSRARVGYPASDVNAIGVGASTDQAELAWYSNHGPQVSVVAPSGGGVMDIYTTDVSIPGRGYNPAPMPAGAHTDTFSGTSSATPLAAGVAALIIDANPKLTREEVRDVLQSTAEKIGDGYSTRGATAGHSNRFGYGRVDAQAAIAEAKRRRR